MVSSPVVFLSILLLQSDTRITGFSSRRSIIKTSRLASNSISPPPPYSSSSPSSATRLFGIGNWRDSASSIVPHANDGDNNSNGLFARRVPILPSRKVVLQGETKYFHFHSDEELRFFQRAVDEHHGVFGMSVILGEDPDDGDDVIMDKIQLMEIKQQYTKLGVDFGICCTAQAVGRAKVLTMLESETGTSVDRGYIVDGEPLMAICEEHFDDQECVDSMKEAYALALEAVDLIADLSREEQKILSKDNEIVPTDVVNLIVDLSKNEQDILSEDDEATAMDVVDLISDLPKEEQEILSEDDEEEYEEETRQDRFQQVFLASLESEISRGYVVCEDPTTEGTVSWKDINAISWAAFCSNSEPAVDETFRLHAMDLDKITDRLRLATYWLSDVRDRAAANTI